jgi:hypothetical protein
MTCEIVEPQSAQEGLFMREFRMLWSVCGGDF